MQVIILRLISVSLVYSISLERQHVIYWSKINTVGILCLLELSCSCLLYQYTMPDKIDILEHAWQ